MDILLGLLKALFFIIFIPIGGLIVMASSYICLFSILQVIYPDLNDEVKLPAWLILIAWVIQIIRPDAIAPRGDPGLEPAMDG